MELTRDTATDVEGIYGQSALGYAEYADATSAESAYEQTVSLFEQQLMELLIAGKIMIKQIDEEDVVYLASNYYVELNSARLLTDLQLRYDMEQDELEREIQKIEKEEKLTLDELQRAAVKSAIEAGVAEPMVDGKSGFLYFDKNESICYSLHWEHYFQHIIQKYNNTYKVQIPVITPHVCRHTYCSNMAKSGMNPKALQYLMGHSEISVTLNTYTHVNLEDAREEIARIQVV